MTRNQANIYRKQTAAWRKFELEGGNHCPSCGSDRFNIRKVMQNKEGLYWLFSCPRNECKIRWAKLPETLVKEAEMLNNIEQEG